MDPLGFLLDVIKAHDDIERVRAEARERILRKYGAELGLEVPECCGVETDCHGLRPRNDRVTDCHSGKAASQ